MNVVEKFLISESKWEPVDTRCSEGHHEWLTMGRLMGDGQSLSVYIPTDELLIEQQLYFGLAIRRWRENLG